MIRTHKAWLATAPLDMRAGTALARVAAVFGAAHPHHAYQQQGVSNYRHRWLISPEYEVTLTQKNPPTNEPGGGSF